MQESLTWKKTISDYHDTYQKAYAMEDGLNYETEPLESIISHREMECYWEEL
jgi:hypothetical protein